MSLCCGGVGEEWVGGLETASERMEWSYVCESGFFI